MTDAEKRHAGGIYKTAGGRIASVLPNAKLGIDRGRMSAQVVVCTDAIDRDRERILPKGIATLNHSRNPQVDFQHQSGEPVGLARVRAADGFTGDYTVKMDARGRLVAETFFHQDTELGCQVFEMVEKGALPGVSLTMQPVPNMVRKFDARDGGRPITVYEAGDLVSYSHVWQPANPECLAEIVHKGLGGKPLCRPLLDTFSPLVGERRPVVVSGWDSLAEIRKYLPPGQPEPQDDLGPPPVDQDPNAQPPGGDPHTDTTNKAVGMMMESWFAKLCAGTIDEAGFLDKMKHLAETRGIHTGEAESGDDQDLDGLDDEDEDDELDLDDETEPDDLDDEDDAFDAPPKKREKFYHEYTPAMQDWISKSYRLVNSLAARLDRGEKIGTIKLKAICDQILAEAEALEPVRKEIDAGRLVSKAAWPDDWAA